MPCANYAAAAGTRNVACRVRFDVLEVRNTILCSCTRHACTTRMFMPADCDIRSSKWRCRAARKRISATLASRSPVFVGESSSPEGRRAALPNNALVNGVSDFGLAEQIHKRTKLTTWSRDAEPPLYAHEPSVTRQLQTTCPTCAVLHGPTSRPDHTSRARPAPRVLTCENAANADCSRVADHDGQQQTRCRDALKVTTVTEVSETKLFGSAVQGVLQWISVQR